MTGFGAKVWQRGPAEWPAYYEHFSLSRHGSPQYQGAGSSPITGFRESELAKDGVPLAGHEFRFSNLDFRLQQSAIPFTSLLP
jgi:hypothetical protein